MSSGVVYKVRAVRVSDGCVFHLTRCPSTKKWSFIGRGHLFDTEQDAKFRMRAEVVRYLRSGKDGEEWKIQIVEVLMGSRINERVVWPKSDVPVLDRMARL